MERTFSPPSTLFLLSSVRPVFRSSLPRQDMNLQTDPIAQSSQRQFLSLSLSLSPFSFWKTESGAGSRRDDTQQSRSREKQQHQDQQFQRHQHQMNPPRGRRRRRCHACLLCFGSVTLLPLLLHTTVWWCVGVVSVDLHNTISCLTPAQQRNHPMHTHSPKPREGPAPPPPLRSVSRRRRRHQRNGCGGSVAYLDPPEIAFPSSSSSSLSLYDYEHGDRRH